MKEKIKKTLLQELRELCKHNKYICKICDRLGFISFISGLISLLGGWFFITTAIILGIVADEEKQKYATLGIISGSIGFIVAVISEILINPDNAGYTITKGIIFAILGTAYTIYKNSKSRKEE